MVSFKKEISERIREQRDLICGGLLTFEEYKDRCGHLRGLELALELYQVEQEEGENK